MKLKALIFDVDGTLANNEEAHRCAFNAAFRQHGTGWYWSKPKYAQLLRTTGGKERIGAYVSSVGLPPDEERALRERIGALHATKTDTYTRIVREGGVRLRAGVEDLIEEAERAGVRLAIASTTSLANIEALLTTALGSNAPSRFSVIGAGDQVAHKKPASDIYELVLKQLGLSASHCIAIEDSAQGVIAAKGAGLFTVVTPSYWTEKDDFTAADWVVPSLASIARPIRPTATARVGDRLLRLEELERRLNSYGIVQPSETGDPK